MRPGQVWGQIDAPGQQRIWISRVAECWMISECLVVVTVFSPVTKHCTRRQTRLLCDSFSKLIDRVVVLRHNRHKIGHFGDVFPQANLLAWHRKKLNLTQQKHTFTNQKKCTTTQTHTRLTAGFSGTTQVSRYQKGKTNLDFTEARDSEWQWHPLDQMQVCTSLQTDNHASTPPLSFLQAGCPSCRPTNSVKALKAKNYNTK